MTSRSEIIHGDCREVLPALPSDFVDAIVTDPPYEIGYMGKAWDKSSVALSVEFWRECLRVLKPGGHILCFAHPRRYHRVACAIEDAGFEIRDQAIWLYGSGFPKSVNLGDGQGTATKAAHEDIIIARKPCAGTVAACVASNGTGGLQIDACRIEPAEGETIARWPANVLHDDSDAARDVLGSSSRYFYHPKASLADRDEDLDDLDLVSPSVITGRAQGTAGLANPRAGTRSGARRNHHPTVKPTEVMRWLCRLVTPPRGCVLDPFAGSGSTGKAARLEGMAFLGIEIDPEYIEIARRRAHAST